MGLLPLASSNRTLYTARSLVGTLFTFVVILSAITRPSDALSCLQCCSCQGDSRACQTSGAPLFTYINSVGTVTCDAWSNVCGTIKLMDITNNQALTLKSCYTSNMCSALVKLVGTDIPFFYLGEINTRVVSVNCCNSDGCNASSAPLTVVVPSKLLLGAIAMLLLVLFR